MSADNSMNASLGGGDASVATPSTSRIPRARNDCITHCEPLVLSQLWTIEHFTSIIKLARPGQCFRSQVFRDQGMPDACWQLCLYPNGKREENADNVSLFLKMSATSPSKEVIVKAEYRFYFVEESGKPGFSNVNIGEFHAKPPKGGHSWGLRNIPRQKVLNCVRADNSLVISCIIELMPDMNRMASKRVNVGNPIVVTEVSNAHVDAELRLLRSGEGSDFAIEVAGTRKPVHKFKIMTHSSVFRAMVSHEHMLEAKEGVLRMDESVTEQSVRLMLEYMYCGRLMGDVKREDAFEVMVLADKYDIPDLKGCCEQKLIHTTHKENVVESLYMADIHNAETLFQHCLDIAIANKSSILKTEAWKRLKDTDPRLMASVLERMVETGQSPPPVKRSRL